MQKAKFDLKIPIDFHTHISNTISFYVTQKPVKKHYIECPYKCQGFLQKKFF